MTKTYVGVKRVTAWPQEKDGKAGYAVKYEDGYISWSPADVFERSYFRLNDDSGSSLTEFDITRFFESVESIKMGEKTTVAKATLINGFEMVEGSSCVDPANYNEDVGTKICVGKMRDKVWMLLGFVLQWGRSGIKPEKNRLEL
jgi:hypothetical protein